MTTMTHEQAMRQRQSPDSRDPNPQCRALLIDPSAYVASDVSWVAYTCPACGICIATVEGRAHWWNAVVDPSPSRARRSRGIAGLSTLATALLLTLTLGGSALAADTLTFTSPTSGHTLTLPFIGTPAYSDSCAIVASWEDGSARAYCAEDGARYSFDADGGYIYDHGIKLFYRDPGTWREVTS